MRRTPFPPEAIAWLTGRHQRVLQMGATPGLAAQLTAAGHSVTVVDPDPATLAHLPADAQPVAAQAEALPFDPWSFDVILFCQNLHRTRPRPTMVEVARSLAPGGHIGVLYTTRDDTVPWVRRLAALLQQADPDAMRGDDGSDSAERLDQSHYFPTVERATFRTWFPISRPALLAMVERRPRIQALDAAVREDLLAGVGEIYDQMARGPEPLLLPYQAACTRAVVAHDELTVPITFEDGLRIL